MHHFESVGQSGEFSVGLDEIIPNLLEFHLLIARTLQQDDTEENRKEVIAGVAELTRDYPLYKEMREWLQPLELEAEA